MSEALLRLEGICKSFGHLQVLKDIELNVAAGEIVAIQGASGTGKSTLLNITGLLDTADDGAVYLSERCISDGLSPDQQAGIRGSELGFIFQAYHLLPEFTVLENILMPVRCLGHTALDQRPAALQLLDQLGLANRHDDYPAVLSGGERQRVAVCRALINKPKLVLADEPTGNLDPETTRAVLNQIFALIRDMHSSVLLVSHDPYVCAQADRVFELNNQQLQPVPATPQQQRQQ